MDVIEDVTSSGNRPMEVSEMIKSTLITLGYPETLERDLEYTGDLLTRAVQRLRKKEPKVDLHDDPSNPDAASQQLRSMLVIKAVSNLQQKYDEAPRR